MARRKAGENKVTVGSITDVSGEVTIAGGDIYKGFTAEQVSVLLTQITSKYRRKPFDGRCPYKGLDVFEEEDAELFFGRERLVNDLVNRVKESRTVFITGPSGSGKSSLVRAGLIHALKEGKIKGSERWLYETMKPGREPVKDLALAFSRLKGPDLTDYFLAHANETDVLNKCAESVLSGQKTQRFVLFIDQFEEIFTQINGEEERQAFINMLAHAGTVENGRVIVLFAMRSDFVSNCATYPALNELLSQEFRQIGAMQPDELVSAIALPARHVGLPIEDELIVRIINDMKGEPGALPLMQFALKDLFDSRQEKGGVIALTLEDYLRHGGIQKSLERHADASLATLGEHEQELTRSIFRGLIEIGRGTQDTKRTALFDELVPANASTEEVLAIVQKLADARLIITDEQAGKDTVTISHEKLIDAWPWLKKLVNENRDAIALQNEIANDAKEWGEKKRDASYLYSGARLINAREQLESRRLFLSGTAQEFVKAGISRQKRGQFILITGIATFIGLLLIAVVVFGRQSGINAELAQRNEEIANTAQSASTSAFQQEATAQANADEAERQADEAKKQALIALARQLASQAQSIDASRDIYKDIVVLLAVQSMKIIPSIEAAQVLLNSNFGGVCLNISNMTHDGDVTSVAFSPDGQYIVSGSDDGTARKWDICGEEEIASMDVDGPVNSVTFSPDGKYVVSAGGSTIHVGEPLTWKEIAHMTLERPVTSVALSLDGKYVVSSSWWDSTIHVWETLTGREVTRMTHNTVVSVAFSPDGQYVVSGGQGSVRVWKAFTGQEVAHMPHDALVTSVAFSADGKYVISAVHSTIHVWEPLTGKEIAHMTIEEGITSIAVSPDSKYVVSGSYDHTARVWEVSTGLEVARMTHDSRVTAVAFSQDSKYVVSGSSWDSSDSRGYGSTARVWDASTGVEVARINHGYSVTSVAFSPDGKNVVSAGCDKLDYFVENGISCIEGSARVWIWQPDDLIANVCGNNFGIRNLTRAEWKQYIGDALPYQAVCENSPIEPEVTATPAPVLISPTSVETNIPTNTPLALPTFDFSSVSTPTP